MDGNKLSESEKRQEVEGAEIAEPDEVRLARQELNMLHREKERTEKLRLSVQRELDDAKNRATKIEEVGRGYISTV